MSKKTLPDGAFWMVTEDIRFDDLDLQDHDPYTDEDFYPDSSF